MPLKIFLKKVRLVSRHIFRACIPRVYTSVKGTVLIFGALMNRKIKYASALIPSISATVGNLLNIF